MVDIEMMMDDDGWLMMMMMMMTRLIVDVISLIPLELYASLVEYSSVIILI